MDRDFAASVLRQALLADPKSEETDWRRNRHVYCLIIGWHVPWGGYLQAPEDFELFFRFLDPRQPHYRRFRAIQRHYLCEPGSKSQFSILNLPAEFQTPEGATERNNMAEVLLNACLLSPWWTVEGAPYRAGLPPVGGLPQPELEKLRDQRVAGIFLHRDDDSCVREVSFNGTVRESYNIVLFILRKYNS